MAKDLVFLAAIFVFWFIVITGFSLVTADESFQQLAIGGNTTFETVEFNATFDADGTDTTVSIIGFQRTNAWGMVARVFTFRISGITGIPPLVAIMISFLNWFLVVMMIILAYRILVGAG